MKGREKSCLKKDDLQSNIGQEPGAVLTYPAHERGEDLQIFGLLSAEKGERTQHEREDALQGEAQQTRSLETGNHLITPSTSRKRNSASAARTKATRSSATSKERSKQFNGNTRMVPSACQRLEHLINPEAPKRETLHVSATALIAYLTLFLIPAAIRGRSSATGAPIHQLPSTLPLTPPFALRHPHDHV